jgi:hypothetical protein
LVSDLLCAPFTTTTMHWPPLKIGVDSTQIYLHRAGYSAVNNQKCTRNSDPDLFAPQTPPQTPLLHLPNLSSLFFLHLILGNQKRRNWWNEQQSRVVPFLPLNAKAPQSSHTSQRHIPPSNTSVPSRKTCTGCRSPVQGPKHEESPVLITAS